MKRISFTSLDAAHLYEYLIQYWIADGNGNKFGGCHQCERIGKRLQRMIGSREAGRIRLVLREQARAGIKKRKVTNAR